jgi:sugar phosphate isomerase/epimerase
LRQSTRRRFLSQAAAAAGALLWAAGKTAVATDALGPVAAIGPDLKFPSQARERIAVASYPFREFIAGLEDGANPPAHKMGLEEFAAHVVAKFNVNKIEPWSRHFRSLAPDYLEKLRQAVENAHAAIVNIAVDGERSPYAADRIEREQAVAFSKQWIDVAVSIGSRSVRTNMPPAKDSKPDVDRAAESLHRVAEYGSVKKIIVNLENDNPVSEDPFFIVKVIERVGSPWLHALPDFANSLATGNEEHAYQGIDAMFAHAYGICHIKAMEANDAGKVFHVDLDKTFGILKSHAYKGYCSMEFDSPGDPYSGTADLIQKTLAYLS